MAHYLYRCDEGHEREATHKMSIANFIIISCKECGGHMHRVPQAFSVNWGGLSPSQGEIHPNILNQLGRGYEND